MEDANQTYHEMSQLAAEFAQAESERVYLSEFRKSKKALLMKDAEIRNPGMSAAAQEREAYANAEYMQLLDSLKYTTEKALFAKYKLKQYEMRFEAWRTRCATERAQMNIR